MDKTALLRKHSDTRSKKFKNLSLNSPHRLAREIWGTPTCFLYTIVEMDTGKKSVAKIKPENDKNFLAHEWNVYGKLSFGEVPPRGLLVPFGLLSVQDHTFLLMNRLGPSIASLLQKCRGKFTLKTTLMITIQTLERLQYIHNRGILHMDLEPTNMLMGRSNEAVLFLVDFDKAHDLNDGGHPRNVAGRHPLFASRHVHDGLEPSRRDDLESLMYIMIFLYWGSLPWSLTQGRGDEQIFRKCGSEKKIIALMKLCDGLPTQMRRCVRYVLSLEAQELPNYDLLKRLLNASLKNEDVVQDGLFDWMM